MRSYAMFCLDCVFISFKFNDTNKLRNKIAMNVKHAQQKYRFKKECKTLLVTRIKQEEEVNFVTNLEEMSSTSIAC